MELIDEFLYALGFQTDLRGGQAFDEQLERIGDHGESTRGSLLKTITAANLLSSALEKGAELAAELGGEFLRTAKEMEDAKITFESMYTTAAEGEEKFKWLRNFATENPVMGFEAAKETFLSLKNNGIDPTAASLKAVGDAMAALPEAGKMIPQGIGELIEGRYASGGVLSPIVNLAGAGKNRVYEGSYVNKEGVKVPVKLDFNDAEKATDQLMQIMRDKFDGTMNAHAKTMTGLLARWGSDWQDFEMNIMDNHVFASLEDKLSDLVIQWEVWARSPDAHEMLSGVAEILTVIIDIIGAAISITGTVLEKFTAWFGTTNSIAILLGTMFLASKWTTIIGLVMRLATVFRDVYAALQLVAEGEKVVTVLGVLMDGVLSPLSLIVVAVMAVGAGIAYMVKQWHDFRLGLLDSGPMHSFLQMLEHGFIRIRASIEYMFESMKIGLLETQAAMAKMGLMNELTPAQQKELGSLNNTHKAGVGSYIDKQIDIADTKQNRQESFVSFTRQAMKDHSDWDQSKIWTAYKQHELKNSADTLAGDMATISSKKYSPGTALGERTSPQKNTPVEQRDDHSISIHGPVNVYTNDAQGFAAGLQQANSGLASTRQNLNSGGKKY